MPGCRCLIIFHPMGPHGTPQTQTAPAPRKRRMDPGITRVTTPKHCTAPSGLQWTAIKRQTSTMTQGGRPSGERIESMFSAATESVTGEGAPPVEDITPGCALRGGFGESRRSDVSALMRCRAVVMKFPQKFLRGAFRSVIRFASQEANAASMARDERRQCRVEIVPLGPSDGVEGG